MRAAIAVLCLLAIAGCSAKFGDEDVGQEVCSSAEAYAMPQLSKARSCSSSLAVSIGGGQSISFAKANGAVLKLQSKACSEAVSDGMHKLCGGADPMHTVYTMSSACASAMATLQATAVSDAKVDPAVPYPPEDYSKTAFLLACSDACSSAEASASTMAKAAACSFSKASLGCSSVKSQIQSANFASAFLRGTTKAWSQACVAGYGEAQAQGEAFANSMVSVFTKAFGEVVTKACSGCSTCTCGKMPGNWTYADIKDRSEVAEEVVKGRYALARTLYESQAAYCGAEGTPPVAMSAAVDATLKSVARIVMTTALRVAGVATAEGKSALSCAGGAAHTTVRAAKRSIVTAVADAAAAVYGQSCAKAVTALKKGLASLDKKIDRVYVRIVRGCAKSKGGKFDVFDAQKVVDDEVADDKALAAAISNALNEGKSCGCKPQSCTFCLFKKKPAAKKTVEVQPFEGGNVPPTVDPDPTYVPEGIPVDDNVHLQVGR